MPNEEKSKSILEIVLMPLVIALVGGIATLLITNVQNSNTRDLTRVQMESAERMAVAQLDQAREESNANRQAKLLEIFGDKITSSNPEDKKLALTLLRLVDPALAENLTKMVLREENTPDEIKEFARKELDLRLQLSAVADPTSIAVGDKTSIVVTVLDNRGGPVRNADVTLTAGGGKFLRRVDEPYDRNARLQGPYTATGTTDGAGRFTTWWVCNPCAPAYGLSVEATKPNYLGGKSDLTINVH